MKTRAILLSAVLLALLSALSYAQAPVPFINLPLMPDATAPGGADFTLTVNGTGFVSNSVVNWNGVALATQFVNGSQLTATVPAANIATASTAWVTVVNPPPGGGTSNTTYFAVTGNVGNNVAIALTSSPVVGGSPTSVATGDFNGDGKLDLAVANLDSSVSIVLGDGTGNFTLASSPAGDSHSYSVAVGDFNGDSNLDLAVANVDSSVSICLGDGTGNFALASSVPVGNRARAVTVGDFNRDGKLDLAATGCISESCSDSRSVSILLGDGTGNFALASSVPVGNNPQAVTVGDFNRDGKLDLVIANSWSNSLSVLLGDGTGNFTPFSSPSVGFPISVAIGDFNGDGKLDLAVSNDGNQQAGTVSILSGDGTGNFTLTWSTTSPGDHLTVAAGDFNGDGNLDLAVANGCGGVPYCPFPSTVSILLGDGTGKFSFATLSAVGSDPLSVAVGDFNGDGKLDLTVGNYEDNTVSILLQGLYPGVGLSPSSLNFGTQLVLTSSNPQMVTLTNTGSAALDISSLVASANFFEKNNCGTTLAPNAKCTISVEFKPRSVGNITGTVTLTDNALNSPQNIPLSGVSTAVTLLPSNLDFGNQVVGSTSQPQIVTLTNYDTAAVSIFRVRFIGNNAGAFVQTNTCGTSVPAGGSCAINVTFTPHGTGPKITTLEVVDNAGASPQSVSLSGTGYSLVTLSPTSLTFATQLVGTTSGPQYVTLSNTGYVTLDIISIVANGNFAQTNTCGSSLAAGQRCTITVTFDPQQINQNKGRITITDNAPTSPQTVPLTGVGTEVTLLPSNLNFGHQPQGTASQPRTVTLTNYDTAAVSIFRVRFIGNNAGAFVQTNTCGTSVPAGGSCAINVTFTPHGTGPKITMLEVVDNGGGSPQTVWLDGFGTK